MKKTISLILCMMIFVSLLAGCSCKHNWLEANCLTAKTCSICQVVEGEPLGHTWVDADCVTAKTCSVCLETEGDPLGHAPGEWKESIEMITCTGTKEQYCSVCSELIASEAVTASTLVQDDLFLFTPREFMDRLTRIAEQHSDNFTYEFIFSSVGLQVLADIDGNQNIIQFFFKTNILFFCAFRRSFYSSACVPDFFSGMPRKKKTIYVKFVIFISVLIYADCTSGKRH
jgi:hypothetical protein